MWGFKIKINADLGRVHVHFCLYDGTFRVVSGDLLLGLASTAILGSGSGRTHDHIFVSHDSGSCATTLTALSEISIKFHVVSDRWVEAPTKFKPGISYWDLPPHGTSFSSTTRQTHTVFGKVSSVTQFGWPWLALYVATRMSCVTAWLALSLGRILFLRSVHE
jgi:hypothetical protein